jgi:hypothetical protein
VDNHHVAGYITKLGAKKKKKQKNKKNFAHPGTSDLDINYIIILLPRIVLCLQLYLLLQKRKITLARDACSRPLYY